MGVGIDWLSLIIDPFCCSWCDKDFYLFDYVKIYHVYSTLSGN